MYGILLFHYRVKSSITDRTVEKPHFRKESRVQTLEFPEGKYNHLSITNCNRACFAKLAPCGFQESSAGTLVKSGNSMLFQG